MLRRRRAVFLRIFYQGIEGSARFCWKSVHRLLWKYSDLFFPFLILKCRCCRQNAVLTDFLLEDNRKWRLCRKLVHRLLSTYSKLFYPFWFNSAAATNVMPPKLCFNGFFLGDIRICRFSWKSVQRLLSSLLYIVTLFWSVLALKRRYHRCNATKTPFKQIFANGIFRIETLLKCHKKWITHNLGLYGWIQFLYYTLNK